MSDGYKCSSTVYVKHIILKLYQSFWFKCQLLHRNCTSGVQICEVACYSVHRAYEKCVENRCLECKQ